MKKRNFSEIENWIKPLLSISVATIPLTSIILFSCFKKNPADTIEVGLGFLMFQIGFVIYLFFELNKQIIRKGPKQITKIQFNSEFWDKSDNYRKLYLNVINGERFLECLVDKEIKVQHIQIIAPTDKAIRTYYDGDTVVENNKTSAEQAIATIQRIIKKGEALKTSAGVQKFEVRRLSSFPLDFYAIFDRKVCLVGKYVKDPLRHDSVGLKSLSWVENDFQLINHHTLHFEELWSSLENARN
jgi:hypothetical protein